jgi:hypothetical protein
MFLQARENKNIRMMACSNITPHLSSGMRELKGILSLTG